MKSKQIIQAVTQKQNKQLKQTISNKTNISHHQKNSETHNNPKDTPNNPKQTKEKRNKQSNSPLTTNH